MIIPRSGSYTAADLNSTTHEILTSPTCQLFMIESSRFSSNGTSYTRPMDNITHTIIGTLVGEVAARVAPGGRSTLPATTRRNLCVTLAAIGSNLPDADLMYSFFGGKLNYLLQHRGYTHTILIALLL